MHHEAGQQAAFSFGDIPGCRLCVFCLGAAELRNSEVGLV